MASIDAQFYQDNVARAQKYSLSWWCRPSVRAERLLPQLFVAPCLSSPCCHDVGERVPSTVEVVANCKLPGVGDEFDDLVLTGQHWDDLVLSEKHFYIPEPAAATALCAGSGDLDKPLFAEREPEAWLDQAVSQGTDGSFGLGEDDHDECASLSSGRQYDANGSVHGDPRGVVKDTPRGVVEAIPEDTDQDAADATQGVDDGTDEGANAGVADEGIAGVADEGVAEEVPLSEPRGPGGSARLLARCRDPTFGVSRVGATTPPSRPLKLLPAESDYVDPQETTVESVVPPVDLHAVDRQSSDMSSLDGLSVREKPIEVPKVLVPTFSAGSRMGMERRSGTARASVKRLVSALKRTSQCPVGDRDSRRFFQVDAASSVKRVTFNENVSVSALMRPTSESRVVGLSTGDKRSQKIMWNLLPGHH
mmetsp:Transcript_97399/g.275398  ORF Transcript_97399/g.275398 Transcript_97399/m.275398 type:complete len:421 (-) Transcript_97399:126-1388(-)